MRIESKDDLINLLERINSNDTCKLFVDFCNDNCPFLDDYEGCLISSFTDMAIDRIKMSNMK